MNNYLEIIDKYLDGVMKEDELQTFKEELKVNKSLKKAFILQKEMRLLLSDDEWSDLDPTLLNTEKGKKLKSYIESENAVKIKGTINSVISEHKKSLSKKNFIKKIAIAASILLAITVSYFVYTTDNNKLNYTNLLAQEIESLPSLVNRSNNYNKLLTEGQLKFEKKKFKKATEIFNKYQTTTSEKVNSLSYIYNGLCFLELNDFENALHQFKLLELSESLQAKKAKWYKVLTYLKQNKKEALIKELKIITSNSINYKYEKAHELLFINK